MSESQSQVATRISDERSLRVGTGRSTSTTEVGERALDAHAFRELAGAEQAVASGNRQRRQFDPTRGTAQAVFSHGTHEMMQGLVAIASNQHQDRKSTRLNSSH